MADIEFLGVVDTGGDLAPRIWVDRAFAWVVVMAPRRSWRSSSPGGDWRLSTPRAWRRHPVDATCAGGARGDQSGRRSGDGFCPEGPSRDHRRRSACPVALWIRESRHLVTVASSMRMRLRRRGSPAGLVRGGHPSSDPDSSEQAGGDQIGGDEHLRLVMRRFDTASGTRVPSLCGS